MAGETKYVCVFGLDVPGLIFIKIFIREWFNEQIRVFASVRCMAYDAAVIPGCRLVREWHFHHFLLDIPHLAGLSTIYLDFPVVTAQAECFRAADEQGILVACMGIMTVQAALPLQDYAVFRALGSLSGDRIMTLKTKAV
jgi:hypothetical protein